jgi:hypothetical protein
MNIEEFERLRDLIQDDRSAELTCEPAEEDEDVRYFGFSSRYHDVPDYLNFFASRGLMEWRKPYSLHDV